MDGNIQMRSFREEEALREVAFPAGKAPGPVCRRSTLPAFSVTHSPGRACWRLFNKTPSWR